MPRPSPPKIETPPGIEKWEYNPKQLELTSSPAPYLLSVGGIRSGKTSGALMYGMHRYVLRHGCCDILVLRRTFRELETGAITDLKTFVPRELYDYNEAKHIATFHNGSRVIFGHCTYNRERDILQYLGQAYPFILVDECAQFSPDAWELFCSRNTVNAGCKLDVAGELPMPRIWGCTNPIGPFWTFYKSIFIDKIPFPMPESSKRARDGSWWVSEAGETRCVYDPARFAYSHSTVLDNPPLLKRDPGIVPRLNALSKAKRNKMLFGYLDKVDGQYFDNFAPEHHVINLREDPEAIIWQDWQPVWMGWDWGRVHWNAVYFFTKAMARHGLSGDYRLKTICFREFIVQDKANLEMARVVGKLAKHPATGARLKVTAIYFSHEKFSRQMEAHSPADEMSRLLREQGLPPVSPSTRDRIASASYLYNLLQTGELAFLDTCPEIINALPTLQRNPDVLDDVLKVNSKADDCYDALRYGVFGQFTARKMPQERADRAKLDSIPDAFARRLFQLERTLKREAAMGHVYQPDWAWRVRTPEL